MGRTILQFFKQFLTMIGAKMSAGMFHQLHMVFNYMELGRWMVENDFQVERRVPDRKAVFASVATKIQENRSCILSSVCSKVTVCAIGPVRLSTLKPNCMASTVSRACPKILTWYIRGPHTTLRGRSPRSTIHASSFSRVGLMKSCQRTTYPSTKRSS